LPLIRFHDEAFLRANIPKRTAQHRQFDMAAACLDAGSGLSCTPGLFKSLRIAAVRRMGLKRLDDIFPSNRDIWGPSLIGSLWLTKVLEPKPGGGTRKSPMIPRLTGKKKDAETLRLINNKGRQETKMETWRPNLAHTCGSTSRLA
jgi:hypothetical protein